ncbi:hypothetical protein [Roseivivax isoporae]|uniref:Uncharacterized protein n=1 Tax=Roseivivax isoporae LMG 25204 TaxID=1449351 RepID=X7F2U0_9RHOB|nr:hypothetical protein [Roseivivax isoporae]ETX27100.1 hypothetical protein RISW2_16665 [Roseivivax isoporae LMG 25204]
MTLATGTKTHPVAVSVDGLRYTPEAEAFDALVTLDTDEGRMRVPGRFAAPLDTSEEEAIAGLKADALRSLDRPCALRSRLRPRVRDTAPEDVLPLHQRIAHFFWNRAA